MEPFLRKKLLEENSFLLKTFCFSLLMGLISFSSNGATRYWKGGTNSTFLTASNWSTGIAPVAGDDIVIGDASFTGANQPTLNSNLTIANLTFGTSKSATLTITGGLITLNVTGDLTLQNAAGTASLANIAGTGTINISGSLNVGNNTTPTGSFSSTLTSSINVINIGTNLFLQSEQAGARRNNAVFTVANGTMNIAGAIKTDNANSSNICTLNENATAQINLSGALPNALSALGTNTLNFNGTTQYNGVVPQTLISDSYNNLIISNNSSTGVNVVADNTVTGMLNILSGSAFTFASTAALLGNLTTSGIGLLKTLNTSATPFTSGRTWSFSVEYGAAVAQTIMNGTYNGQLILSGSGTGSASGTMTVNGGLAIGTGCTLSFGSTFDLVGSIGATSGAGLLKIASTSTTPIPSGNTWNFDVEFNATGSAQQTIPGGNYTNLLLTGNSTGNKTAAAAFNVTGNLTCNTTGGASSSNLDLNNSGASMRTFNIGNLNIIQGIIDGGSVNVTPTTNIYTSTINIAGNLTIGVSGQLTNLSNNDYNFINFTGLGNISVGNTNGYQAVTTNFIGTANITLLSNLQITDSGPSTVTLFTISSNATLDASTFKITVPSQPGFKILLDGTLRTANVAGFSGAPGTAISSTNSPTITLGGSSTVEYYGSGQTITARNYDNLAFSGTGVKTFATGNSTVSDNWTSAGGKIDLLTNSAVINFNGTTAQTITDAGSDGGNGVVYKDINFTNVGTKTFSGKIGVAGNWTSTGGNIDFLTNSTAVNFSGATQSISDAGSGADGVYFKDVNFSGGGTKTMSGTGAGKFSIDGSGVLTMSASTILDAGGKLWLKSSEGLTATVAAIPVTSGIIGNVYAERFMKGGNLIARRGYRLMSSPVHISAAPLKYNVLNLKQNMYITGSLDAVSNVNPLNANDKSLFDYSLAHNPTIYHYRESSLGANTQFDYYGISLPLDRQEFNVAEGAYVFFRGIRSNTLNRFLTSLAVEDNVVVFNGDLNRGPYSPTLSYTNSSTAASDGFNLVGNPYPSTIDLTKVIATNITDFFYVLNPTTKTFNAYNKTTPASSTGDATQYIASGQGFFVQAKNAGATIPFTENAKVTQQLITGTGITPPKLLMGAGPNIKQTQPQILKFLLSSSSDQFAVDDISILFTQEGKVMYDQLEDASDFGGNSTTFLSSFSKDNVKLAINSYPLISKDTKVKLSVNSTVSGDFNLVASNFGSLDNKFDAVLIDNYKADTIKLSAQSTYSFKVDRAVPATYVDGRFELAFEAKPVLVNAVLNFYGNGVADHINVGWKLGSATKVVEFTLEKSIDNINFYPLTNFTSDNREIYNYVDKQPNLGLNYYRLIQVDVNGQSKSTSVIEVNYSNLALPNKGFIIYPMPVTSKLNIVLDKIYSSEIYVRIIDIYGKVVLKTSFTASNSSIDFASFAVGTYLIELTNAKSVLYRSKFVKQ